MPWISESERETKRGGGGKDQFMKDEEIIKTTFANVARSFGARRRAMQKRRSRLENTGWYTGDGSMEER